MLNPPLFSSSQFSEKITLNESMLKQRANLAVIGLLWLLFASTATAQTITTDFNTSPVTAAVLGGFPSPRTATFDGWMFTATASGNLNLILAAGGGASGSSTDRFASAVIGGPGIEMQTLRAGLGTNFKLESVYIETGFAPSTGPGQLRLIGLSAGVPVPGAQVDTASLPNSAIGAVVDTSAIAAFGNVDGFEVQVLNAGPEYISIGIDNIVRSPAAAAPPPFDSSVGSQGSGNGQFDFPTAMDISPIDGRIYVVDRNNERVQIFDAGFNYLDQFGSVGSGNGQFANNAVESIAIDSSGNLWVVDRANHRVQRFDSNGNYVAQFGSQGTANGQFDNPEGIAIDPATGNIWVGDRNNERVQVFNAAGAFQFGFGALGSGNGQFSQNGGPIDFAFDVSGNVWIVDRNGDRVQQFDTSGTYLGEIGGSGNAPGQLNRPDAVAVHPNGQVWVADRNNERVQIFDGAGNFVTAFGSSGNGNGQFAPNAGAVDIAFDALGDAYVVDRNNHRVQIFDVDFTPANNAPTAAGFTAAPGPFEDLTYTFASSDFGYADADSDPLVSILIEASPAAGTLYVDANGNNIIDPGEILSSGTSVSLADLNAGRLKYIQNGSTNTSFQFEVFDGTDFSSGNYVATLNVSPIPTVTLGVSPSSRLESVSTSNAITATLSNTYGVDTTVNLDFFGTATRFIDYSVSNSSITIPAGSTSGSVTLSNIDDALFESDETVVVDIASVINGSEAGVQEVTYTILNDDPLPTVDLFVTDTPPPMMPPQLLKSITIADEDGGQAWVIARLSASAGVTVTVPLSFSGTATGGGTDYSVSSSTVVIAPGDIEDQISVTSLADGVEEGDETVIVDMGAPTNGQENGVQQVTITIVDEDLSPPVFNSLVRQSPIDQNTNADTLTFRATFDSDVQNVDAADFTVNGGSTATVSNVTMVTASVFDLTVSGGDLAGFDGTVGLDLAAGQNITDAFGNALPAVEPVTDETYSLNNAAPVLQSIIRQNPTDENTNADTLVFRLTFDSDVQDVDAVDFVVSGGSTAMVSAVATVTADSIYDLTVSGGDLVSFDGPVGLDLAAGQNITDAFGNALPAVEPATDETYSLDNTAPVLQSITRQSPTDENTNADTLTFRATFDSNVQNVNAADLMVSGGSTATVTNVAVATADSVFDVTVSGGDAADFDGMVGLDLAVSQDISDAAGNALPTAEPAIDETYTLDNTAPVLIAIERSDPDNENTNVDTLTFGITFEIDIQNVDSADFVVSGGSTADVEIPGVGVITPAGITFIATVSGGDLAGFDGTVGLDLAMGQDITDAAGNALPNTEPAVDETYTLDNTAPIVTVDALTTNDTTPALSGSVDDVDATLELVVDGQTVNPTNNTDGTWTLANDILTALPFGTYDVQVTATDTIGNTGQDETVDELIITNDVDGDGVPDGIEQAGPNNGDGNNDGIPDAEQSRVASLPTATGRGYMTLVLTNDSCSQMEQVAAVDPTTLPPDSPTVAYPFGLVEFTLPCEAAIVDVIYQEASALEFQNATYRKYGPVIPGDAGTTAWYDFSSFASVNQTTWTLDLADNRLGDDTGDDGVIVDQGGPAISIEPLIVPVNQPWALVLMMLLMMMLGMYWYPGRR